jgi:hypothetical protein
MGYIFVPMTLALAERLYKRLRHQAQRRYGPRVDKAMEDIRAFQSVNSVLQRWKNVGREIEDRKDELELVKDVFAAIAPALNASLGLDIDALHTPARRHVNVSNTRGYVQNVVAYANALRHVVRARLELKLPDAPAHPRAENLARWFEESKRTREPTMSTLDVHIRLRIADSADNEPQRPRNKTELIALLNQATPGSVRTTRYRKRFPTLELVEEESEGQQLVFVPDERERIVLLHDWIERLTPLCGGAMPAHDLLLEGQWFRWGLPWNQEVQLDTSEPIYAPKLKQRYPFPSITYLSLGDAISPKDLLKHYEALRRDLGLGNKGIHMDISSERLAYLALEVKEFDGISSATSSFCGTVRDVWHQQPDKSKFPRDKFTTVGSVRKALDRVEKKYATLTQSEIPLLLFDNGQP